MSSGMIKPNFVRRGARLIRIGLKINALIFVNRKNSMILRQGFARNGVQIPKTSGITKLYLVNLVVKMPKNTGT